MSLQVTAKNDEQTTSEDVYIPVYDPNTEEIIYKRCNDYPYCPDEDIAISIGDE